MKFNMLRKNGEKKWVYEKGRKIVMEEGRSAIIGVVIDISKSVERQEDAAERGRTGCADWNFQPESGGAADKKSLFRKKKTACCFMMDIDILRS